MDWNTISYAIGALGFLLTAGTVVFHAGRWRERTQQTDRYSRETDEGFDRRLKDLEAEQLAAKVESNRRDIERLWDYVGPTAEQYLSGGGAVKFNGPSEGGNDG